MLYQIKLFLTPCAENNYRPQVLDGRFLAYIAFGLIALKFVGLLYFVVIPRTNFFADISGSVLVRMANSDRGELGLPQLTESPLLNRAAYFKAQDMAQKGYFSHWSPEGISPWHWIKEAGYDYQYAGENLAMGFLDASEVHGAWLNSSSHRANILNSKYNEVGIAVVESNFQGQKVFLVVQMFGSRSNVATSGGSREAPISYPTGESEITETTELLPETVIGNNEVSLPDGMLAESGKLALGDYDEGIYFENPSIARVSDIKMGLLGFFMTEYDSLIQKAVVIIFSFLVFILFINVFVRFDVQHPDLIFKGLFFLGLFVVFSHLDQKMIVDFMSGNLIIG